MHTQTGLCKLRAELEREPSSAVHVNRKYLHDVSATQTTTQLLYETVKINCFPRAPQPNSDIYLSFKPLLTSLHIKTIVQVIQLIIHLFAY